MNIIEVKPYQKIENENFLEETTLLISKSNFENKEFIDGRITFSITDCFFKKLIIENYEETDFNISIAFSGCYIERLEVENVISKKIDILFFTSIISGLLQNNNLRNLSINNCLLNSTLFAINIKSINVSFTEENLFPRIWKRLIHKLKINNFEEFIKQPQSYHFQNIAILNFFTHEIPEKKRGIEVDKKTKTEDYKIKYFLTDKEKKQFSISLNLSYDNNFEHLYSKINNSYLYALSLKGNPKGPIRIENGRIQRIYIRDLSPETELTFYNIKPLLELKQLAKIEIHKSNLKNTWFDNFNFSEYSTVSFFRTRFSETSFTSCNFPKDSISFENFKSLENVHYPENLKENFYKDQYETFLQLKNALEKSGNIYEAQKLQAISFEALRKVKDVSVLDKFILFLNNFSNQHGLSISKPLKWFLIFSIFFYFIYLYSLGRFFNTENIDWNLIGYYFSFIDLTHRTDFLVSKEEFTAYSLTIDFINKIFVGYFIYQFVAAFRKYGKGK